MWATARALESCLPTTVNQVVYDKLGDAVVMQACSHLRALLSYTVSFPS